MSAGSRIAVALFGMALAGTLGYGAFEYNRTGEIPVVGQFLNPPARSAIPNATPAMRRVEAMLRRELENSPHAETFDRFRTGFPEDYASFVRVQAGLVESGSSGQQLHTAAEAFMAQFVLENAGHIAAADQELLASIVVAISQAMDLIAQENEAACATLLARTEIDPIAQGTLSQGAQRALAQGSAIMFDAILSGRANPRTYAPIAEDEMTPIVESMRAAGISEDAMMYWGQGVLGALPPSQQCALGVAFYRAVAAQPPEFRARFMSYAMQMVAQQGSLP